MNRSLDEALAQEFAAIALAGVEREYPNHVTHFLNGGEDVRPPRALHPAFYGCLDWHSAVHSHWLLARLAQRFPHSGFAAEAEQVLHRHLSAGAVAGERAYFEAPGREGFERPYGWAWLLALDTELSPWPELRAALAPLVELVASRVAPWLAALPYPVRAGEHSNTAFALGLILDWCRAGGDAALASAIVAACERFYRPDTDAPLAWEPSGHDFLPPILAEADLMARIYDPEDFARWLSGFLPGIPTGNTSWLQPATMPDSTDYKLAHLPGVNLSRAWMLAAIAARLPAEDLRRGALIAAAGAHAEAGLGAALRSDYGASHWLPTFAVYCLTHPARP